MLLIDCEPLQIWKMLLPKKNVLFSEENDDLIFFYRDQLYFAHGDGAIVRMKKPEKAEKMTADDLWELLFYEKDTYDYDDHGVFSIGAVLLEMGYLVQLNQRKKKDYHVELVNLIEPGQIRWMEFHQVPFQYALSQALIECHRLNLENDGRDEYNVLQVTELEQPIERFH